MQDLLFSVQLMAIGFVVVLVVLFLLNVIFQAFGTFLTNDSNRKEARNAEKILKQKENDKSVNIPQASVKLTEKEDPGISPEILAVITGAVSVYLERPGYQLRVKKVKRGNHLAPWVLSGTDDVIITYGREN